MLKKSITLMLLLPILTGCGSQSDSIGYRAARTTLAGLTLGLSEFQITAAEKAATKSRNRAKEICLEAGLTESTPEYTKCFLDIKKAQFGAPKPMVVNQTVN